MPCISGHHVYQTFWTPVVGEELPIKKEENNKHNKHAVAVLKSDDVVGHVPCTITRESWFFLLLCIVVFSCLNNHVVLN